MLHLDVNWDIPRDRAINWFVATPGTIVNAFCGACTIRSANAASEAGQSTYGASTHP